MNPKMMALQSALAAKKKPVKGSAAEEATETPTFEKKESETTEKPAVKKVAPKKAGAFPFFQKAKMRGKA